MRGKIPKIEGITSLKRGHLFGWFSDCGVSRKRLSYFVFKTKKIGVVSNFAYSEGLQ